MLPKPAVADITLTICLRLKHIHILQQYFSAFQITPQKKMHGRLKMILKKVKISIQNSFCQKIKAYIQNKILWNDDTMSIYSPT